MRKLLAAFLLMAAVIAAPAQSFYTAIIETTNVTQTGNALTNNGAVAIFTNAQSATTILTNLASAAAASTNIWAHISLNRPRYPGQNVSPKTNATSVTLYSAQPILIGILGTWGYVTYYTNAGVDGYSPRLPFSTLPLTESTNQATDITTGLKYSTHLAETNSQWLGNFLSLGVSFGGIIQTAVTEKVFWKFQGTNSGRIYGGGYANATGFTNVDAQRINFKHFANRDAAENLGGGQMIFYDHETNAISAIRAGTNGVPGLYDAGGGLLWNNDHYAVPIGTLLSGPQLLNVASALEYFPLLTGIPAIGRGSNNWSGPNYWSNSSNNFAAGFTASYSISTSSTNIGGYQTNTTSDGLSSSNNLFKGTNVFRGDVSFERADITTVAAGNNRLNVGTNVFIRITGSPGAAWTLVGIEGGNRNGKLLKIYFNTGFNVTVGHQAGTETVAENRIISLTAADQTSALDGAAEFIYDAGQSRWVMLQFSP